MLTNLKCCICENCGRLYIVNINISRNINNYKPPYINRYNKLIQETYNNFKFCSSKCCQIYNGRKKSKGIKNFYSKLSKKERDIIFKNNLFKTNNPMHNLKSRQKLKNNYYKKTGYYNPSQNPEVQLTKRNNYLIKTNGKYYHQFNDPCIHKICEDKSKITIFNKTGFMSAFGNPNIVKQIEDKREKLTGYRNPFQNPEIIKSNYEKKVKNKTLWTSSYEVNFYNELLNYFNNMDIVKQYYDKIRYPHHVDFYIKSLDLFIELNFHYSHFWRPYNENDKKCVETYNYYKIKNNYINALNIWIKSDVIKFNNAKKNNLNYVMIYNKQDWSRFFNLLKCGITDFRDKLYNNENYV